MIANIDHPEKLNAEQWELVRQTADAFNRTIDVRYSDGDEFLIDADCVTGKVTIGFGATSSAILRSLSA